MPKELWNKMIGEGEHVVFEFTIGARWRKLQIATISLPLLASVIVLGSFAGFGSLWFGVALGVWLAISASLFAYYQYYIPASNAYALTNKRIVIHLGWLNTHTTTIEYGKITDVSITQSFLDRLLTNTGGIHINTAGTSGHEVVLTHIENPFEIKRKLGEVA